jgi:YHS domain-containing protein
MSHYFRQVQLKQFFVATSLVAFMMWVPATSNAQSGSKQAGSSAKAQGSATTQGSATAQGSATRIAKPAMEGYCPVCIVDMKKWVAGNANFQSTFDGQAYLFPGQEQKAAFDANPTKYVPVLAGDCVVALMKMNQRVPGNIRHAAINNGRLFLFSNEMAKQEFTDNEAAFANVDLALGGKCTVCKVEMQKDVDGKAEISVLYQGMRYYFPATEQRNMFIANPVRYALSKNSRQGVGNATRGGSTNSGSGAKTTGQGSSKK